MNKITDFAFVLLTIQICSVIGIFLEDKTVYSKVKFSQACLNLAKANNLEQRCEFYTCFEERFPCGPEYWIQKMGYKYCKRFSNETYVQEFTPNGRKIIDHINKCLPANISKKYYAKSTKSVKCKSLNDNSFKFQQKCYENIQKDFCIGFSENKKLFLNLLDTSDLSNLNSVSMMKNVIDKCDPPIDIFTLLSEFNNRNS